VSLVANSEHLAILTQGVEAWNLWRDAHPNTRPDLTGADLRNLDLDVALYCHPEDQFQETSPYGVDLKGTLLRSVDLRDVTLWVGVFDGADLSKAVLDDAILTHTSFRGSILNEASLIRTHFRACDLKNADFTRARVERTIFSEVDLSAARGLNAVDHGGPSVISIDTLVKSNGLIPIEFLRGCGIPDTLIGYLSSLNRVIRFDSCFISHSTKDQAFADQLHADLQNAGIRCWFSPHNVKGGRKLRDQINEAILLYDRLLLVLSEHSMKSEWVKTEIAHARQKELTGKRQVLFPISLVPFEEIRDWKCFDADTGKDSGREIREYFIPDFSNWENHDSYRSAFARLVSDLKAEESTTSKEAL